MFSVSNNSEPIRISGKAADGRLITYICGFKNVSQANKLKHKDSYRVTEDDK
jgi:hypothetical protein